MRVIGMSWRVRYIRSCRCRTGRVRGVPVLYAFWHGCQLPLIHTHRNEGITVLVSLNTDGQYVTNVLHSMGFRTVRGSSSRGGAAALKGMADKLRHGIDCAITPDGPRGPEREAKVGSALISRLGGRPVIPMGTSAFPAVRFKSWDRFLLPLPFSRVTVVEGRPLHPLARGQDPERWISRFETRLNSVTNCARLFTSPAAMTQSLLLSAAASFFGPLIRGVLTFRPKQERRERLGFAETECRRPVWLHGSSLGELNGLLPYVGILRERGIPVHVTCFTPAGRGFIAERGLDGGFMPLDVPGYVRRFLDRVEPRALILSETELWPNALVEVIRRRIPAIMVNARISGGKGYRFLSPLLGRTLSCFCAVLTRSREDLEIFDSLGVDRCVLRISGDSKLLSDSGDPPEEWRDLLGTGKKVLVAGSTRENEEEVILAACRESGFFPVIVPRHLERVESIDVLMRRMGYHPARWSELMSGSKDSSFDSVITDVQGVLARMYGIGDAAFVGGTIAEIGGHNVLEPAMRGVPFTVGPHHDNFRSIVAELEGSGAAFTFSDSSQLAEILRNLPETHEIRRIVSEGFAGVREKLIGGILEALEDSGILEDDGKT